MKQILTLIFLIFTSVFFAQDENRIIKEIKATRTSQPPKIDGKLDDKVWYTAKTAGNFVMFDPGSGDPEPEEQKTEVKILYDDNAIYIAGYIYDSNPDNILRQLTERDNWGTTDGFGISINPNNDGQNEFGFFVTAAGVQLDVQVSPANGEDYSWNEVWYSKISFDDKGWYAEIKLPYSALRFSKESDYVWGVNFFRGIQKKSELYTWNPIDKTKGSASQYTGILTGIKDIDPPTRLSFSPFSTFIYDNYDGDSDTNFSFGMDLKYGITDNFTLIATLIPDFSQAGFDAITLNLGPFEQMYREQRQFFVEGADLLSKGDLFFSRRIGNRPVGHSDANDFVDGDENLEIINNPTEVDVINAVKVTGRTKKGLGIAVLNAITKETEASYKDITTDEITKMVTEPVTNYNVLVVDQEFNKNSSIGLVNTNVLRSGSYRDANVTSLVFNLANKENSYKLSGDGSSSIVREENENTTGFASNLSFGKTKGNVRFSLRHRFMDDKYDKNDLGFQSRNNYNNFSGYVFYKIFEPTKHFNQFQTGLFAGHFRRFKPSVFTGNYVHLFGYATTKKQLRFGWELGSNIGKRIDYFEPRTEGRYWEKDPQIELEAWISTDYRKKLAFDFSVSRGNYMGNDENDFSFSISPRYRVNDKLQFNYSFGMERDFHELGYVTTLEDETIIFGERETAEIENTLGGKYSFNDRSSLSLAFRHYWSPVTYEDAYFKLEDEGELSDSDYTGDNDINFNSWNLDLRYIWEFARGSQLIALYRNSILNFEEETSPDFQDNISNLFDQPFGHSLSIKLIYYIDYNRVRSWFPKKQEYSSSESGLFKRKFDLFTRDI
ncbi:MAG: DUF5916 domain-containing protein [Bacteroidota bacterium]